MAKTYTLEADGTNLPASYLNTYLMKQTVIQAQTTDRPSAPQVGMTVVETDYSATDSNGNTAGLKQYVTPTTGWVPPWNMPWGRRTSATLTVAPSAFTAQTNLLTVTFTAIQNRIYNIRGFVFGMRSTVSGDLAMTGITLSGAYLQQAYVPCVVSGSNWGSAAAPWYEYTHTAATASITFALTSQRILGTGSITADAASTAPITLQVEDIGPSGAPV